MNKSTSYTPYDNVFHTMVQRMPKYLIPLVNEIFHENFRPEAEVVVQSNDLPAEDDSGEIKRRYSDSLFSIKGTETKLFHIECESRPDGTIVIRMVEYGFHKALQDGYYENGEYVLKMPDAAVLLLRHTRMTPDQFWVRIITPGEEARYPVKVLKAGNYSLKEIFQKDLLFLLPFHIFAYEKDLAAIDQDQEKVEQLKLTYGEILRHLAERSDRGEMSANEGSLLMTLMRHVLDGVAENYDQVREVGNTMLGRVIEDDFTRLLDQLDEMDRKIADKEREISAAEAKLGEAETKLGETETKLGEAETKLGETETTLGETETKLSNVERLSDDIRRATEYLTAHGRAEEIIQLYREDSFLEEVLKMCR